MFAAIAVRIIRIENVQTTTIETLKRQHLIDSVTNIARHIEIEALQKRIRKIESFQYKQHEDIKTLKNKQQ